MSELERKNGPSAVAETVTKDGRRIGTEILFSAKDITKTFGGTQALKGVELEIHPARSWVWWARTARASPPC